MNTHQHINTIIIVCVALCTAGCTTTRNLSTVTEAHAYIDGGSGVVSTRASSETRTESTTRHDDVITETEILVSYTAGDFDAEDIRVEGDSISFLNETTGMRQSLHSRSIEVIELIQRGGGAFEGFLFGTLGGALAGAAIERTMISGGGHPGAGLGGLIVGGVIGAVGGTTVGALLGHTQELILPEGGLRHAGAGEERRE
jgi:hypothetical protein